MLNHSPRWPATSLVAVLLGLCAGCGDEPVAVTPPLFRPAPAADLPDLGATHGGTFLDLDGDGFLDLLAPDPAGQIMLYLNGGALDFTKTGRRDYAGLARAEARGMAACDYDNDGDWDVFVAADTDSGRAYGRNHLWVRQGADKFVDLGQDDPVLSDPIGRGRGGLWADFDGDAGLELLVFNFQSPVLLATRTAAGWRNANSWLPWPPPVAMDAKGPAPEPRVRARSGWVHTALAVDLDGNGRQDLLAIGRPGWSGVLMNEGPGPLVERTAQSGLKHAIWPKTPVHVGCGDIDEDGRPDLVFCYLTADEFTRSYSPVEVWLNRGQPGAPAFVMERFVEQAGEQNTLLQGVNKPVGAILADLDNDGHLDLYVVQPPRAAASAPNRIYRGHGDATFSDVTDQWDGGGPTDSAPESAWAVDLDNDGDLELLTFNGGEPMLPTALHRGLALYENRGTGGVPPIVAEDGPPDDATIAAAAVASGNRGITVHLADPRGPAHGLGAVVTLIDGERRQVRWQTCTVGGDGTAVLPLHFGVGRATGPYRLEVRWADGTEQTCSILAAGAAYLVTAGKEGAAVLPRRTEGGGS